MASHLIGSSAGKDAGWRSKDSGEKHHFFKSRFFTAV
jgi:hypothetical protein